MNFDDDPKSASLRAKARAWIAENRFDWVFDDDAVLFQAAKRWQAKKFKDGWGCLSWPAAFGGRDSSQAEELIVMQEENAAGMGPLRDMMIINTKITGLTLMACASPEQQQQHLPRIASGEESWCQLFSEPGAGSDLAGISTRAVRQGDKWVINGQKVWTSLAHEADWGLLVTRTDPGQPKHKGMTYFIVDMKTPGIDVRPIRQATGECEFNEVYLTDVSIPDANRLGEVGDGWRVAMATLSNERAALAGTAATDFDKAWALANSTPLDDGMAIDNASVRSLLAQWYVWSAGLNNFNLRLQSGISQGKLPGPEATVGKVMMGSRRQDYLSQLVDLLDMGGIAWDKNDAMRLHFNFFRVVANRLEGGTDEILRNIIGERVLGLPAEPRVDKEIPFNQLPGAKS